MPIKILPARLANQIAAGEVVERPASVVKELIENSLDAGATRIDIEIEQGGAKCIRIQDNGTGVSKEELTLALSRHATSKISHLDDLEAIVSLGFRGEALASVSSVSRLTFTSKPAEQDQAWQAVAEGRDMQVNVQPAAHPQGTTVEVLDLFFNTPARRRFLKTEKTEFQHIDDLIKRIALSRFDIAITLKHNHKMMRQYRAAPEQLQQEKRIASICSEQFIQHALFFEYADQALKISGWVSDRLSPRLLADVQYCYINGRMIRDKLVNHAIKQAYSHFLPQGMFPGYIIYIECNAKEVDVNVHPAKHEVRFHQARWVHDFISSSINTTLNDSSLLSHQTDSASVYSDDTDRHSYSSSTSRYGEGVGHEHKPPSSSSGQYQGNYLSQSNRRLNPELTHQQSGAYCDFVAEAYQNNTILTVHGNSVESDEPPKKNGKVIAFIGSDYALLQVEHSPFSELTDNNLLLIILKQANKRSVFQHLLSAWEDGEVISQPLLLPVRFKADTWMGEIAEQSSQLLNRLGFIYKFQSSFIIVTQVPSYFRHSPIAIILPKLFEYLNQSTSKQGEFDINLVCEQLSTLFVEHEPERILTVTEVELLLNTLKNTSMAELKDCLIQPNLSLLLQGIH
jgi:DNA mismatch repair protein MutL